MKLGVQVGLGPGHIVLDGDPARPTERGTAAPTLSKFMGSGFACVRTIRSPCLLWRSGWMDQMPFGAEVGLGPGYIVLDGTQLPLAKEAQPPCPQFLTHVRCGQMAGWIKMPRLWSHSVRWGPHSPSPTDRFAIWVDLGGLTEAQVQL